MAAEGETGHGEEGGSVSGHHGSSTLLYLWVTVLMGVLTKVFLNGVPIPYTALCLIWGLILGLADTAWLDWDEMGRGINLWRQLTPELLLLIFLPILIFSSAFHVDWHVFKKGLGQVLILAGPGVVMGTALTGLIAQYVFPYDWTWAQCWLFGAMFSATDPVAVVALLKEVGASKKLGHVIEGESLFNDGTAFVFFLLFLDSVEASESLEFGPSVALFARLALGGPAIGLAFGLTMTALLTFIYADEVAEITITLMGAYLSFYVAEDLAGSSGVLAVVVTGLSMAAEGRARISAQAHHALDMFWEMLEYIANTVIFIYAGVVIAAGIYEGANPPEGEEESKILGSDWGYALLLYVLLTVVRALIILVVYPSFQAIGYPISWKDAVVMVWGGLRGAVGLALALIVNLDDQIEDLRYRQLVLFQMGVVAACTLIINGSTTPLLLRYLGLSRPSPAKLDVFLSLVDEVEGVADRNLGFLKHDALLGDPDWAMVHKLSDLDVQALLPSHEEVIDIVQAATDDKVDAPEVAAHAVLAKLHRMSMAAPVTDSSSFSASKTHSQTKKERRLADEMQHAQDVAAVGEENMRHLNEALVLSDIRTRFLHAVKAVYGEGFEKGYIGVNSQKDLREAVDLSLDRCHKPLCDWDHIVKTTRLPKYVLLVDRITQALPNVRLGSAGRLFGVRNVLFEALANSASTVAAFVFAHRQAQKEVREAVEKELSLPDGPEVGGDLHKSTESKEIRARATTDVLQESAAQCKVAITYLRTMKKAYPEIMRAVKTQQAAKTVLMHKARLLTHLKSSGIIEDREAEELSKMIKKRMKDLTFSPPQVMVPLAYDLLHAHPLFSDLSNALFQSDVWPHCKSRLFEPDTLIFKEGDSSSKIFVVVRGAVTVQCENGETRKEGAGAMVGLTEVLLSIPRKRSMKTVTVVQAYAIASADFLRIMEVHGSVRLRSWQIIAASRATVYGSYDMTLLDYSELQVLFRHSDLQDAAEGDEIRVTSSAFLTVGSVTEDGFQRREPSVLEAPSPLGPGPAVYRAVTPCKVLHLRADYGSRTNTKHQNQLRQMLTLNRAVSPRMGGSGDGGGGLHRDSHLMPSTTTADRPRGPSLQRFSSVVFGSSRGEAGSGRGLENNSFAGVSGAGQGGVGGCRFIGKNAPTSRQSLDNSRLTSSGFPSQQLRRVGSGPDQPPVSETKPLDMAGIELQPTVSPPELPSLSVRRGSAPAEPLLEDLLEADGPAPEADGPAPEADGPAPEADGPSSAAPSTDLE